MPDISHKVLTENSPYARTRRTDQPHGPLDGAITRRLRDVAVRRIGQASHRGRSSVGPNPSDARRRLSSSHLGHITGPAVQSNLSRTKRRHAEVTRLRHRVPNAWAFSRTRASRVTMVTSCGASPSSSVVARCTASSVRIGSTGNGRRTRASTARSTSRMKQRRSKVRRARTAACSSSAVNRPVARARMIARPASARVRADVTCCVPTGGGFMAAVSCSNSAATSALDSMYRMLAAGSFGPASTRGCLRAERRRGALRFATIAVDQFGGRARAAAGCPASPRTGHRLRLAGGECRPQRARPIGFAGDVRAPCPGGTSSATTRPWAVTEIRSPASIRRM